MAASLASAPELQKKTLSILASAVNRSARCPVLQLEKTLKLDPAHKLDMMFLTMKFGMAVLQNFSKR